jgi:hypothetical protein
LCPIATRSKPPFKARLNAAAFIMVWNEIETRFKRGPCGFNAAYGAIMAAFKATQKTPVNKNTRDLVSIASKTGRNRIYYALSSVDNQVLMRLMRRTPHPYRYF